MSHRRAKPPRISGLPKTRFYEGDSDVEQMFSADASVAEVSASLAGSKLDDYLEARSRGREVRITEDGGKTSYRIGVLLARLRSNLLLLSFAAGDPLVLTPEEFARRFPTSEFARARQRFEGLE